MPVPPTTDTDLTPLFYGLLSVVHTDEEGTLLTDRQREGYFAVPRECTLAELADELGVDRSAASETIRRGTARVVEQFLLSGESASACRSPKRVFTKR